MISNMDDYVRVHSTPIQQKPREPSQTTPVVSQKIRYTMIGIILAIALIAFEIFNFDTTQYALGDLLGDVRFAGVRWATILAIAFCGIDFAGLLRVFTPDTDGETPREVWYLMIAWLLGATMNASMTWYAVSVTLLNHEIGNEVISREQLLMVVPIFVAILVWLTRITFIGALSLASGQLFAEAMGQAGQNRPNRAIPQRPVRQPQAARIIPKRPIDETYRDIGSYAPDLSEDAVPSENVVPLVPVTETVYRGLNGR